jgi:hypothetical protein
MEECKMCEEHIKETEIDDADVAVVTAKLIGPTCAKPYDTFSMCLWSGYASPLAYFGTEAEALTAHDALAASVMVDYASGVRFG